MTYELLAAAFLAAALNWTALIVKNWRLVYFAKPATMLLLLAWYIQNGGLHAAPIWFFAGCVLSLLGDIFLMLPRERFTAGLIAFLLAHISYILGFNSQLPRLTLPLTGLVALLAVGIFWYYRRIRTAQQLRAKRRLRIPVLTYAIILSLMVVSAAACFTRPGWTSKEAALVTLGAASFMFSDMLLARNKFVRQAAWARPVIMITYHLGQAGILLGVLLRYR